MELRQLGRFGPKASAIGLGCLGMSGGYGPAGEEECTATVRRAVDLGVTLFDTADFYGDGANESFLGRALGAARADVLVSTRGGMRSARPGGPPTVFDGRPASLRAACEASLRRLGTDRVDVYYLARVDPAVPVEESVGALSELVTAGKVAHLGLSEASADQLRRAHAVHPVSVLESEYSLWSRQVEPEVLPAARELGVTLIAHTPLGKGMLAGSVSAPEQLGEGDHRRNHPRFQGDNLARNRLLVTELERLAAPRGVSAAQLALAWLLSRGPDIVPIPGTRRIANLEQNAAATELALRPGDDAELDRIFSAARVHGGARPVRT